VLCDSQLVRRSRADAGCGCFTSFMRRRLWVANGCVVVKYAENDALVVTAYLTDKPKAGEDLWPIK
jgi:hypothetical protein